MVETDAKEVMNERLEEAQRGVKGLQNWLEYVDKEIEDSKKNSRACNISLCEMTIQKALHIYNEVARSNGAVLVQIKE